jgi:hypothetical protein
MYGAELTDAGAWSERAVLPEGEWFYRFGPEPVYFLHIEKTAGSSVHRVLTGALPNNRVCPVRLWQDLEGVNPDDIRDFALYSGHLTGAFSDFVGRRLRTVTILRDPVQRSISHYAHVRRDSASLYHKLAKHMSLREFCLHPETRQLIENYQTRALAGADFSAPRPWPKEIALPGSFEQMNEMLVRAQAAMKDCIAVGITERLSDTLTLFSDVLGVKWSGVTPYENASYNRPQTVDPETLAIIRDLTACDEILYREAGEILTVRLAERTHRMTSGPVAAIVGRQQPVGPRTLAARLALPEQSHRLKLKLSRMLYRAPRPIRVVIVALHRGWIGLISWWRGPHGRLLMRWLRSVRQSRGQRPPAKPATSPVPRSANANFVPVRPQRAAREPVEAVRK